MSRLLSPRKSGIGWEDVGERSALVIRQRVGRIVRRRKPTRVRLARTLLLLGLGLVLLGAAGSTLQWAFTSPRFAVREVEVRGASRVPADRILRTAAIGQGANIFRLDLRAVAERVETLPEIRRAEVVRQLPDRLAIVVQERRPFTLMHTGRLHWLDEEGVLLGPETQAVAPPLPVITGLSDEELATMRTTPSAKARAAVAVIRALLRSGPGLVAEISEIDMSRREGPILHTVDGIEVRLGGEDWDERLARLEGVLGQVTTEDVKAVDLRFRDQVVFQKATP